MMTDARARAFLRRELEMHLQALGYSCVRNTRATSPVPEIARVSPVRGRIAYGETVLRRDLRRRRCHERLLLLSQRRTRRRSSILLFIGVAAADQPALEALLEQLNIQNGIRGGHVHVVPIAAPSQVPSSAPPLALAGHSRAGQSTRTSRTPRLIPVRAKPSTNRSG